MGEHEGCCGQLPNGLLPKEAASAIRVLDLERWSKAEKTTAELIACVQPNQPSEELRNAIADYVHRLISKCFPCQVFTFGSVPLKTYLPDGDIDLTAFSKNPNLKDTWAHQVLDMLENEENNENAEFRVKEVQYIQAEVKLIKCLVENMVVDISFNQLGGLCTLCFLEEVDNLIDQNHLFKRSIILIKAWCYYESRMLGAHHGLISTYALETLVLYIFHVFNNSFAGPLEVLYRFLEFFSKFDWDNFCVSLWGPVPISSLPDVTAEPFRKDCGELLLSKLFLEACSAVYAVLPAVQDNEGQTFLSKHFSVIDPLRTNNNLGRSVSKETIQAANLLIMKLKSTRLMARIVFPPSMIIIPYKAQAKGRYLFARTCSSPELTETYGEISSQGRRNKVQENGKGQALSARLDHSRRKNLESDNSANHGISFSTDDPSSVRHAVSHQSLDTAAASNSYHNDSGLGAMGKEFVSVLGTQGLQQEEQDLVNVMSSSTGLGFNGPVHVPLNNAPGYASLPIPPSVLASIGYGQRNTGGMVPTNIPFIETPWGSNMQFPQGAKAPVKERRGRKMVFSTFQSSLYGKGKGTSEHSSNQTDDDNKERNTLSTMGPEPERSMGSQSESAASLHVSRHQVPGYESAQPRESESLIHIAPVLSGPGSQQRSTVNSGAVPFTFYPAGPPVPVVTMLPLYNFPTETGTSGASTSQFGSEEGHDNSDSGHFDSSEGLDQSEVLSTSSSMRMAASVEPLEHKSDILNSDFASHWQNLQFGWLCQNIQNPAHFIYPSPVMVPPVYVQHHFPWDGPGRPFSNKMNLFTQLMSYGLHIVPAAPQQSASNRSVGVYQYYVDEIPRYRGGTGTYWPNPKVSVQDRHATNMRKGNYNNNRSDHQGYREGNWNNNSRIRAAAEKSNSKPEQLAAGESRAERSLGSHRHDTLCSCQSRNGPIRANSTQSGSTNVAYGMYPLPSLHPGGLSSNGPAISSVVMLYPYDHNAGYGSAEHLEFGSRGPVGFSGVKEGSRSGGGFEDRRFRSSPAQWPSPDQPSPPHVQRGI